MPLKIKMEHAYNTKEIKNPIISSARQMLKSNIKKDVES